MDALSSIKSLFDTIEIRTAYSPPVVINLNSSSGSDVDSAALMAQVRPAIIFRGKGGSFSIAPAGVPEGLSVRDTKILGGGALLALAAVGYTVFMLGRTSRR